MKNIHIGSLIKEQFVKKEKTDKHFNKAVFAEQIHVHRSTIYTIFEQKSIDIDLLFRISEALDYNFIEKIYLKEKEDEDEDEGKLIIGIEVTKQQLKQLKFSDNFPVLLKIINK